MLVKYLFYPSYVCFVLFGLLLFSLGMSLRVMPRKPTSKSGKMTQRSPWPIRNPRGAKPGKASDYVLFLKYFGEVLGMVWFVQYPLSWCVLSLVTGIQEFQ
jgi:hypothetical protein